MISADQKEMRKKYCGSSDSAAVLGLDPYRGVSDVWLEKTGRVDGFAGNEHTERGNLLEPVVLAWAVKKIGIKFDTDVMQIAPCNLLAANFDGIYSRPEGGINSFLVEGKTTINPGEWGDEGTDQVPERVIVQAHHQMFVAGPAMKLAYIPVLMPGFRSFDFKMYRVERNDALADAIAKQCRDFMLNYVHPDIQPDDYRPSLEILKRVRRQPNKSVELPAELVESWQYAKEAVKIAGEKKEQAEAAILAAMGDAEGAMCSKGTLTYLETHRKGYEVKATTYRTLRLKAGKD